MNKSFSLFQISLFSVSFWFLTLVWPYIHGLYSNVAYADLWILSSCTIFLGKNTFPSYYTANWYENKLVLSVYHRHIIVILEALINFLRLSSSSIKYATTKITSLYPIPDEDICQLLTMFRCYHIIKHFNRLHMVILYIDILKTKVVWEPSTLLVLMDII